MGRGLWVVGRGRKNEYSSRSVLCILCMHTEPVIIILDYYY